MMATHYLIKIIRDTIMTGTVTKKSRSIKWLAASQCFLLPFSLSLSLSSPRPILRESLLYARVYTSPVSVLSEAIAIVDPICAH